MGFALGNCLITEVSARAGAVSCLMYFSSGPIIAGLVFNIMRAWKSKKEGGPFWNDQNLVVGGGLRLKNLVAFAVYALIYVGI